MAKPSAPAPHFKECQRVQRVIDARCCVLSGCRFLHTGIDPKTGQPVRSCGAAVFKADLPAEQLHGQVRRNANPHPGHNHTDNPFLLRLLMSPDCLRPECGVAELTVTERVLVIDDAETEGALFA